MILNEIDNAYIGGDQVDKIYLGQDLVWESIDYATIPLTFKIISGETINWLNIGGSLPKTIKYRANGGEWTTIVSSDPGSTINVFPGDVVEFVGDNAAYGTASNFHLSTFSGSTAVFDVYGNIMSLVDSTNFQEETAFTETRVFQKFFAGTGVRNASKLVLPVITLTDYCYTSMFNGCTNLTKAPELPATTMAFDSYNGMFSGCTSLASAPELPATTLQQYCYANMFKGCTSLNYVKCLATDISASGALSNWLNGVASAGTFVKAASMSSWTTGTNGIPSGWTVQDA